MSPRNCQQPPVQLKCVGQCFRILKDTNPNYTSLDVVNWINTVGGIQHEEYGIVPRNTGISRKSLDRYAKPPNPMSSDVEMIWLYAASALPREFGFLMNSRMSSYDESIRGLDSTKSPGYPWTLKYPTKFDYWHSEDANWFDYFWSQLATDDISIIHSCSVKEEMRKKEKILDKNCRTMFAVDVNLIVSQSIFFKNQSETLVNNNLKCCSALGTSLFNGGAQKIYDYMTPWGFIPNMYSIDAKQFDSSFHVVAMRSIYGFRYNMLHSDYKSELNKMRVNNIARLLSEGYIVDIDGRIYLKLTGNPSGQFMTTADNILKNFVDCLSIWCMSVPQSYKNYDSWKKYTRMLFVGDDILMSVHPDFLQYYNYESFQANSKYIGMTYEFENTVPKYFGELSFIGHTFKQVKIPDQNFMMWLPDIDCIKMRNAVRNYNTHLGKPTEKANLISMICGLRLETFACESCRKYFSDLFFYIVSLYGDDQYVKIAMKGFLTDDELWSLFSGITSWNIHYKLKQILITHNEIVENGIANTCMTQHMDPLL